MTGRRAKSFGNPHRAPGLPSSTTKAARDCPIDLSAPVRLSEIDRIIGLNIEQRRTALGMSRKALSEILEASENQVARYERGEARMSPEMLVVFAKTFNIAVSSLFRGVASPSNVESTENSSRWTLIERLQDIIAAASRLRDSLESNPIHETIDPRKLH